MKNFWKKSLPVAALAMLVTLAGCESALAPAPVEQLTPGEVSLARGSDRGKSDSAKGQRVRGAKRNGEYGEWTIAYGKTPLNESKHGEALVDGTQEVVLRAAGHTLTVPAGAVRHPTWFKIKANGRKDAQDHSLEGVTVSLTAERVLRDGTLVNVGELGFLKPVILEMSTEWAEKRDDGEIPTVIWLTKPDQAIETNVVGRDGRRLRVELEHFSDYGLAWPSRCVLRICL